MREKHGFTPKYPDVQAPTATMNIHRLSPLASSGITNKVFTNVL
jgi:hypothetical protein